MINPGEVGSLIKNSLDGTVERLENTKKVRDLERLKQTAEDFEAVFITKMFDIMDQTISRGEGIISQGKEAKVFRTFMHQELAKQIASNPETSFGLAKQMYEQMKDLV